MKIHKIIIENITSLRGTHVIDFDNSLHGEDLFAITGAMGSGKSSILASVSLGLFGKNYKLKDYKDLISLGEGYGKITLDFSTSGRKYTSIWECRIKARGLKDGKELKTPVPKHVFLFEGEQLEESGEQLLGLSFDQFCKTVILNQGEFAKFLTSKYSERKDILEKLYDSEQLALLGQRLNDKITKQSASCREVEVKLEGIELESEESIKKKEERHEEVSLSLSKAEEIKCKASILFQTLKDLAASIRGNIQLTDSIERNSENLKATTDTISDNETHLKQEEDAYNNALKKFNTESPLINDVIQKIAKRDDAVSRKAREEEALHTNVERLSSLELSNKKISKEIQEHKQKRQSIAEGVSLASLTVEQVALTDRIAESISTTDASLDHTLIVLGHHTEDLSVKEARGKEINKKLKELEEELSEISGDKDITAESISSEIDDLKKRLTQVNFTLPRLEELKSKCATEEKKVATLLSTIESLESTSKELNQEHENTLKKIELLKKEKKLGELAHAIELCQKDAEESGQCPVCTTTITSPLEKSVAKNSGTDIDNELDTHSNAINTLVSKISKFQAQSQAASKEHQERLTTISDLELDKKKLLEEYPNGDIQGVEVTLKSEIQSKEIDLKKFEDIAKEIQSTGQLLQETRKGYAKTRNTIQINMDEKSRLDTLLGKEITALTDILPTYPKDSKEIKKLYSLEKDSFAEIIRVDQAIELNQKSIERIQEDVSKTKTEQKKLEDTIETISLGLKKLSSEIDLSPYRDDPNGLLKELQAQKEDSFKRLSGSRTALSVSMKERDGLNARLKELQAENASKKVELESFTKALANYSTDLLAINSIHDFFDGEFSSLFIEGVNKLSTISSSVNILDQEGELLSISSEVATPALNGLEVKSRSLTEERATLKAELSQHSNNIKRAAGLKDEYSKENAKLHRLQALDAIIGKQEFRNYALALIEKELVIQTNHELELICDGRYKLKQIQGGKAISEFYIQDSFNGGIQRKVTTLSGGETFLVSLAMALSLAEMTRGKTQIDSFFIDEGFGSLDESGIEDALETLFAVRNRGKQIGIISHVKNLTERIPINIDVTKDQFGNGTIGVLQN